MQTIYLTRGDPILYPRNRPWVVSVDPTDTKLEIDDDITAPPGWIWEGDYSTSRPTFRETY
jgi:hypothetical protein